MNSTGQRPAWSKLTACAIAVAFVAAAPAQTARHLTTPKEALGFEVGDDYQLATYTQLTDWWKKLAAESDRMKLVAFWRDQIPAGFTQQPGTKSNRIAGQFPVTVGLPADDTALRIAGPTLPGEAALRYRGSVHRRGDR